MTFALIGALAIGLSLGLLGSGGSILTVPILHYLLGHPEKQSIAESLGIVGGIALIGAIPYARKGLIHWKSVFFFGTPGMFGSFIGAHLAKGVPGAVQLALFAFVMLAAAAMMMRRRAPEHSTGRGAPEEAIWQIILQGLLVGVLTGFVGVGGGFLIVPALVLFGGLSMRIAVGSSLCIIAMNSASGFVKQMDVLSNLGLAIDWHVVGLFLLLGILGSFAGNLIGAVIDQRRLRRIFGGFLLVMGLFILIRQGLAR